MFETIQFTFATGGLVKWYLCVSLGSLLEFKYIGVDNSVIYRMVQRIDMGATDTSIVLLDDTYILVLPWHSDADAETDSETDSDSEQYLEVYSLAPSVPNLPLCTLQLPALNLQSRERIRSQYISTSRHSPIPQGHFYADPSASMVIVTHNIKGQTSQNRTTRLLIPCTTLLAQIRAVVDSDSDSDSYDPLEPVPWTDWGSRASLRLWVPPHPPSHDQTALLPYGSRMPIVAFDYAGCTRVSVYVFDINPLVARHCEQLALATHDHDQSESESGEGPGSATATAVVADVEAALPGVVDAECAAIPFAVYRFGLPSSPPERPAVRGIQAVRMSMTGFTVTVSPSHSLPLFYLAMSAPGSLSFAVCRVRATGGRPHLDGLILLLRKCHQGASKEVVQVYEEFVGCCSLKLIIFGRDVRFASTGPNATTTRRGNDSGPGSRTRSRLMQLMA